MQWCLKHLYAIFFCLHLCCIGDFIFYFSSLLNFWNLFRLCLHYINKIIIKNTHFQKLQWRQLSSELRFILQNIMSSCMWSHFYQKYYSNRWTYFIEYRTFLLLLQNQLFPFPSFFPPNRTLLHSDIHSFPRHRMSSKITWFCISFKDQVVIKCIIKVS